MSENKRNVREEVFKLLRAKPDARLQEEIAKVIWVIWIVCGKVKGGVVDKEAFCSWPTSENVTRRLRDVKRDHDVALRTGQCGVDINGKFEVCGCGVKWKSEEAEREEEMYAKEFSSKPDSEMVTMTQELWDKRIPVPKPVHPPFVPLTPEERERKMNITKEAKEKWLKNVS